MSTRRRYGLIGLVLVSLLACTLPGREGSAVVQPTVNIVAPAAGTQVTAGEIVTIQIQAVDQHGVTRVELQVDGRLASTQNLPQPALTYEGTLTWVASSPGSHVLQVQVHSTSGVASEPAAVGVEVIPAETVVTAPEPTRPPDVALPSPVAPTAGPPTVRISPNGSGDYPNLAAAVGAIPAGSTIQLAAGTYALDEPLDVNKSLRLVGAGMDQTFVTGKSGEHVVRFAGTGTFAAEGITFRYEGTNWARVVVVEGGQVDLARCRFAGGVRDDADGKGGTGLWLQGDTRGQVRACRAEGNGLHGIYVQDRAQPTLENNICTGNDYTGIVYFDDAGGVARQNECTGNKAHGISVNEQAQPTLEENTCQNNAECGIYYTGSSGGTAQRNECSENKWGIYVKETANPVLVDNNCHDNTTADVVDQRAAAAPTQPKPTNTPKTPALAGKIAFPVLNADGVHYDTWVVNADGSNPRKLVDRMRQPCFRQDGVMIAVNGEAQYQDHLITMNADGSNQREVSQHVEDSHPSWSPDGIRLSFDTTAAPGGGWQICVVDGPAARKWRAVPGPGDTGLRGRYPTWMPDGRIIFNTADYWSSNTQGGLYAVGEGGGTPARITSSGQDTAPAAHGSVLAFMSIREPGDYEIFRSGIHGLDADLKQLTDNSAQDGLPAWSPDGQHIAFVSDEGGSWGLWVMRADGTSRRKLLALPGALGGDWGDERVSWAP